MSLTGGIALDNIPMLASSMDVAHLDACVTGDQYVIEQKLDGHRVILRIQDGLSPLALTRNGNPYTKGLPDALFQGFPPGRWALDGEWIAPHSGGDGIYWVFDLLDANGMINYGTTLDDRRAVLEAFFDLGLNNPIIRLVPQAKSTEEKRVLVDRCRAMGAEGVMTKVKTGTYQPGARSREIFKAKFVETADVVVMALRDDGKDSVRLGAYDANGLNLIDVGRASLIGKEKSGAFAVGDVLEVRYLYMGAGERLFQPTIMKRRTDKRAEECSVQQFKHVSKTVLASL
jgi:ATP-dependent DNA ligase